jgi:uncharacterized protein (DUF1697 family)
VARFVALLRAVNVGGRKLPMAELRELCTGLGWEGVGTYIQSGNVVFGASGSAAALETELEEAVKERFGFHSDAIVRTAAQWAKLIEGNPFAKEEPNRVLAGLAKRPIAKGAAEAIAAKAGSDERVEQTAEALWFHYPDGVGTSKITPSLIDRAVGSPVTARNARTLIALREMLER